MKKDKNDKKSFSIILPIVLIEKMKTAAFDRTVVEKRWVSVSTMIIEALEKAYGDIEPKMIASILGNEKISESIDR